MNTQIAKSSSVKESGMIMDVTPELATKWLEHNTHNRKVNQTTVDRYAKDMNEGRWKVTHQGIAFDENGTLIDGQHRLWAVFSSGATVKMRVFFNMPTDTMGCVDTGKARSHLDVMKLTSSFDNLSMYHLAILRAMFRRSIPHIRPESVGAETELLQKHKEAIEFALKYFYSTKVAKITTAVVAAVIARAYYSCNKDKLIRFCEVLHSGMAAGPHEYAGAVLWRYLLREGGTARSDRQAKYGKIERALLAFVHDEPISKLCEVKGELFPLPEERDQNR